MVVVFAWDPIFATIATSAGLTVSVTIAVVVEAIVRGFGGGDGVVSAVNVCSLMVAASTATAAFA